MCRTQIVLAVAGLTVAAVLPARQPPSTSATSMPLPAGRPTEAEIDWLMIDQEVRESLYDTDLCRRASAAAAQPLPGDVRELFVRLNLFLRAGYGASARATIAALRASQLYVRDVDREGLCWSWYQAARRGPASATWISSGELDGIVYRLLEVRDFELAQFVLEVFPQAAGESAASLIEHWEKSGWPQEKIDRWLAARAEVWPWGWVAPRAAFLAWRHSAEPLLASLAAAVRAAPADALKAHVYLEALGAVREAESQEAARLAEEADEPPEPQRRERPEWMGDVCRPESALELRELGYALAESGAIRASRTLFDLALATKLKADELEWLISRRQIIVLPREGKLEFRMDVLEQLAMCSRELGDAATAERQDRETEALRRERQQLRLEKEARWSRESRPLSTASAPAAGPNQGARVEAHKCLMRAQEHARQGEHAAAVQAFTEALAIAPQQTGRRRKGFGVRAEAIRDYANYLREQQGPEAAYNLLRQEISEAPRDSESAHLAVLLLMNHQAPDPHDEIFWAYLGNTSDWDYTEEHLIAALLDALPQSQREACWSQLEELARAGAASRARTCGRLLLQEGAAARAISLLERAVAAYDRHGYDRSAISDLCKAYLTVGDWRRAEALLPVFRAQQEPELYWLDEILKAAARDGALDDALRLWRRRANFDRTDLELLPELVRLGMRDRLRTFYAELATTCPESWVPARALALLADAPAP